MAVIHGLNSSCNEIQSFLNQVNKYLDMLGGNSEAQPVACLEFGLGHFWDWFGKVSSIMTPLEHQAHKICQILTSDERYKGKTINLVGISQGGLIAREVVETCDVDINVLYTVGAPHQGVSTMFNCTNKQDLLVNALCEWGNKIFAHLSKSKFLQSIIAPASIYKPWFDIAAFYAGQPWLPMINNEIVVDEERKRKLSSVNHFAMFRWI